VEVLPQVVVDDALGHGVLLLGCRCFARQ